MSDILIEIGEEMERRYGFDCFFWMEWVMCGGKVPDDIKNYYGEDLFK